MFVPNARRWVDVFGLYAYYELYKNGILLYQGITKLSVNERIKNMLETAKDLMIIDILKMLKIG